MMTDKKIDAVRGLAKEIGSSYWSRVDELAFIAAWTRLLAQTVANHTVPFLHKYGDQVIAWAAEIIEADDGSILTVVERVCDAISEIDNDDGWPVDKAGSAINSVCLGAKFGLTMNSRWPAEASDHVWKFATGSGNGNEVVSISRAAWQQHIFGQAMALANMGKKHA